MFCGLLNSKFYNGWYRHASPLPCRFCFDACLASGSSGGKSELPELLPSMMYPAFGFDSTELFVAWPAASFAGCSHRCVPRSPVVRILNCAAPHLIRLRIQGLFLPLTKTPFRFFFRISIPPAVFFDSFSTFFFLCSDRYILDLVSLACLVLILYIYLLIVEFVAVCCSKHAVKCTRTRLDLLRRKKQAMVKFIKKDVADLLANGLQSHAFGRVLSACSTETSTWIVWCEFGMQKLLAEATRWNSTDTSARAEKSIYEMQDHVRLPVMMCS
jgi:hypothetical protein